MQAWVAESQYGRAGEQSASLTQLRQTPRATSHDNPSAQFLSLVHSTHAWSTGLQYGVGTPQLAEVVHETAPSGTGGVPASTPASALADAASSIATAAARNVPTTL